MQNTSELYRSLLVSEHWKETKLAINNVEYGEGEILSVSTDGGLFKELSIGGTASRQIDLQILPQGAIPKQAKIEVFVRLTNGVEYSEWLPKGVFFFSTRETNKSTGVMTVHGYDAMLKTEQEWLDSSYDGENWPMPAKTAVANIAARIGVEVDERTVLSDRFPVQYPVDGEGDLTMREVLGRIAVANAGNWIITDAGKLLLVPLWSIPTETNYLVTEFGNTITIGGVKILV